MAGTLYVVATPIGNLGDITLRAIETLRRADRVVAEDTRRTRGLLGHLGIENKPLSSLEAHATEGDVARVVAWLADGQSVAFVTDAGVPAVSDPGPALVDAAVRAGVSVVPIPGASAVTAAVSASGFGGSAFRFFGFLPRSGTARADALAALLATPEIVVIFESPQRVAGTLTELAELCPSRPMVVARELTKLHEELVRGTVGEVAADAREWIGEVTIVLGPAPNAGAQVAATDAEIDARIEAELCSGSSSKAVAQRVAAWSGRPRREIYERVVAAKSRERTSSGDKSQRGPSSVS